MEAITGIEDLLLQYHLRLQSTPMDFHRYIYNSIDWEDRLIGIKGPKGVGKTTMMLQYIKEHFSNPDDAMYVSLDNLWFENHSLQDFV